MAKKKYKKFSNAEKKAYWLGAGFHVGQTLNLRSSDLMFYMSEKQKKSFVNGREAVDNLNSKFFPSYVGKKK